jgi:hypothetical protein
MDLREQQGLSGVLTIVVHDLHGAVLSEQRVHNLITKDGKMLLAGLLFGQVKALPSIFRIEVGEANTDPAVTDFQLGQFKDSAPCDLPKIEVIDDPTLVKRIRVTVTATLPSRVQGDIQNLVEAGIRIKNTDTDPGTLFNRVKFPAVNRATNVVMTMRWEISF